MSQEIYYFVLAYLVGAIPTGHIVALLSGRGPLFAEGHRRNPDLHEVFRLLGFRLALMVTIIDALKGLFVVWPLLHLMLHLDENTPGKDWHLISIAAALVVIGHCHSLFLGFKGGRGLATMFGVVAALMPWPAVICFILWAGLSFWGLSTNPGALSAAGALPLVALPYLWFFRPERFDYLLVVAFLALWGLWESRESLRGYMGHAKAQRSEPPVEIIAAASTNAAAVPPGDAQPK